MNNIIDYFEKSVQKNKNKIAIIEGEKSITYEKLAIFSKKIGSTIGSILFNEPIIVFMDKGIDAITAFLGIIYSGCYYSLINPELPLIRINEIKKILNSKIVITNDEYYNLAKDYFKDLNILNINELKHHKINNNILNKCYEKHIDTDPLYINFTSGSTGIPKGVVISHRSVIDFINYFTNLFNFKETDIIGNQAPFDFDVSVKDIYSSFKLGATLVIIPKSYFSNPALLLDYICLNKVTTLIWAVSALCLITTFHGLDYKVPTTVNKILFSGEVMPLKHLKNWMDKLPETMFVNLYGPTEITCNCLYYIIDRKKELPGKIPVGKPFPNERVFLINEEGNIITTKNKIGEICVTGSSLGLGYYNNKEITNKVFIQNPLQNNYLELIYKTGDLAYLNNDNDYIFMGRKDYQIKYLGHRIELEEIEKAIMDIKEVIRCCCVFDEEKSKLYAFYIGNISKSLLNQNLRKVLPIFMIPTKIIQLEEFPLTKNGKIDRKKLLEYKGELQCS